MYIWYIRICIHALYLCLYLHAYICLSMYSSSHPSIYAWCLYKYYSWQLELVTSCLSKFACQYGTDMDGCQHFVKTYWYVGHVFPSTVRFADHAKRELASCLRYGACAFCTNSGPVAVHSSCLSHRCSGKFLPQPKPRYHNQKPETATGPGFVQDPEPQYHIQLASSHFAWFPTLKTQSFLKTAVAAGTVLRPHAHHAMIWHYVLLYHVASYSTRVCSVILCYVFILRRDSTVYCIFFL